MDTLDGLFGLNSGITGATDAAEAIVTILESVTDAVYFLDTEARFLYLNARAEALLQRPRAELLGTCVWDAFPSAIGTVFYEHFGRAIETGVAAAVLGSGGGGEAFVTGGLLEGAASVRRTVASGLPVGGRGLEFGAGATAR